MSENHGCPGLSVQLEELLASRPQTRAVSERNFVPEPGLLGLVDLLFSEGVQSPPSMAPVGTFSWGLFLNIRPDPSSVKTQTKFCHCLSSSSESRGGPEGARGGLGGGRLTSLPRTDRSDSGVDRARTAVRMSTDDRSARTSIKVTFP